MSAVDVLSVMDGDAKQAHFSRKRAGSPYAAELASDSAQARAAVVEMVELAAACLVYFEARENIGDEPNEETHLAAGLRGILARVGGEL